MSKIYVNKCYATECFVRHKGKLEVILGVGEKAFYVMVKKVKLVAKIPQLLIACCENKQSNFLFVCSSFKYLRQ